MKRGVGGLVASLATVTIAAVVVALLRPAAAPAKPGHCNVELVRSGRSYTPWHVQRPSPGAKLPGRATIRCERAIVCKRTGGCVSTPGKTLASVRVRLLRGIDGRDAVADARTGQVYVDPDRCSLTDSRRLLCGDRTPPDPNQTPPPAYLRATPSTSLPFGVEFCWTASTGPDTWVRRCPLFLSPWEYPRAYPLVLAEAGATLRLSLGFEPDFVQVSIVRRSGLYGVTTPAPAATLDWNVPDLQMSGLSLLDVYAERVYGPSRDFVHYLARLRVSQ